MENVIRIFEEIKGTTKKTEKEKIIKANQHNQLFLECLKFLLDSKVVTGISKKKLDKKVKTQINGVSPIKNTSNETEFESCMNYLKEHNTGTDVDIHWLQEFINNQSEEHREFYHGMITKSLKLGCDYKIVNKALGYDLIPFFDVMLAEKYADNIEFVQGKEFIITQKLDGNRLVCINKETGAEFYSRQGLKIEGLDDIKKEVEDFLPVGKVYDGEIILRNDNNLPSDKLFRETMKVVRKDGVKKNLVFHIFDMVNLVAFNKGIDSTPCKERKECLHQLFKNSDKLEWLQEVSILYQGTNTDMITQLLDEQIALQHEGVMVNLSDAPYECKRTKSILKVKRMQTCDVRCIDIYEGSGDNKGKLGGITFEFEYDGNIYKCNCGSGFSQEERVGFFSHPDKIVGKIVEIQYFEISSNQKDNNYSMRFPVFKNLRLDKTEISMY